ncbi:MAG: PstS family phosphate ABC transporter substrate-binding protein [Deltaproteobacteria bacterium]|nr:PstS family phosphate ABC transporter substrate-binding protein [Deltaproteobacteria bacterium]
MNPVSRRILPWGVLCAVAGLVSCRDGRPAGQNDRKVVRIDGSSTVFPIAETIAARYMLVKPDADVRVGISGTSVGIAKLCDGLIEIADASRPISREENERCKAHAVQYVEIPIAFDGLAVVVNPKNDWAKDLTLSELRRMWGADSQALVHRWSDIRPGWPDREIHLHGADTQSGTYDYFVEAIGAKAIRTDYVSSSDDNMLVQSVANDELALAFFGFAYWRSNQQRLKLLAVDDENDSNGMGPVNPSPTSVHDGSYQPLARPLFVYVALSALQTSAGADFANYLVQVAEQAVDEIGYVPLEPSTYAALTVRLREREVGSRLLSRRSRVGVSTRDLLGR